MLIKTRIALYYFMLSIVFSVYNPLEEYCISWWCHPIETFSTSLAICAGNSPVTGEFPAQRPVTRSYDVFFDLRLNKRLSKQSWSWWFEMPSCSLWRHCNVQSVSDIYRWTWIVFRNLNVELSHGFFVIRGYVFFKLRFAELLFHLKLLILSSVPYVWKVSQQSWLMEKWCLLNTISYTSLPGMYRLPTNNSPNTRPPHYSGISQNSWSIRYISSFLPRPNIFCVLHYKWHIYASIWIVSLLVQVLGCRLSSIKQLH